MAPQRLFSSNSRTASRTAESRTPASAPGRDLQRRLRRALFALGALFGASAAAIVAGVAALVVRVFATQVPPAILGAAVVAVSLLAALLCGAIAAARMTPPLESCRARADDAASANGRYLVDGLPGADAWPEPVVEESSPSVVLRGLVPLAALFVSLAFALCVVLLPQRFFERAAPRAATSLSTLVERERERVEQLRDDSLVAQDTADALLQELERLSSDDATDPAHILEALDHLEDALQTAAAQRLEALQNERSAQLATQALLNQLQQTLANGSLSSDQIDEARKALSDWIAQQDALAQALRDALQEALTEIPDDLTPQQLEALRKLIEQAATQNAAQCASCGQLAKLSPEDLKKLLDDIAKNGCNNPGACQNALSLALAAGGPAGDAAEKISSGCNGGGKEGGSQEGGGDGAEGGTDGGGHAALTWGDASSAAAPGNDVSLSAIYAPDASAATSLRGVSASAPDVSDAPAAVSSGALRNSDAPDAAPPSAPVLPHHREAVRRYFAP